MVDFAKRNKDLRRMMRDYGTPAEQRRARILDLMDVRQAKVEAMNDVVFLQHLNYCRENSSTPEHLNMGARGESMSYDEVLHYIMLPELLKRMPRLIPYHTCFHHFLCKPGREPCNQRCTYDHSQEIPF